jgi:hypothetical protein
MPGARALRAGRGGQIGLGRASIGALALTAMLGTVGSAPGQDARYPDWSGQWTRTGGVQWDPSKPPGRGQQAPLTAEYQAIHQAHMTDQTAGGRGGNPTFDCLPPGMPRVMTLVEPMEIIITPEVTYIRIEYMSTFRRIYTDGRSWPAVVRPSFAGYSIGHWDAQDGDGALAIETRGLRGPRSFDSAGMPLHQDNQTVVKERIFLDRGDRDVLHDEITTIDHALTRPWTVTKNYRRNRAPTWLEYVCAEENRWVVIGKENYFVSLEGDLMPTRKGQQAPDLRNFDRARQ